MTGFEEIKTAVEVVQAAESVLYHLRENNPGIVEAFYQILKNNLVLQIGLYNFKDATGDCGFIRWRLSRILEEPYSEPIVGFNITEIC